MRMKKCPRYKYMIEADRLRDRLSRYFDAFGFSKSSVAFLIGISEVSLNEFLAGTYFPPKLIRTRMRRFMGTDHSETLRKKQGIDTLRVVLHNLHIMVASTKKARRKKKLRLI